MERMLRSTMPRLDSMALLKPPHANDTSFIALSEQPPTMGSSDSHTYLQGGTGAAAWTRAYPLPQSTKAAKVHRQPSTASHTTIEHGARGSTALRAVPRASWEAGAARRARARTCALTMGTSRPAWALTG